MLIKILFYITALGLTMISSALSAQGKLEVTVRKIKETKGNVRVGLFINEKDFLKKATIGKVVKVTAHEVVVNFEDLQPGDYAISIIHDENENGALDTNMIGIPKEGFAFGNNAMGTFGPPSFQSAKITIKKDLVKQVIDMKYF
jgi:uncharacterized protein (DUF2141 family)